MTMVTCLNHPSSAPLFLNLVLETVGTRWRMAVAVVYHASFCLGYMLWSAIAYIYRDWKEMQVGYSNLFQLSLTLWQAETERRISGLLLPVRMGQSVTGRPCALNGAILLRFETVLQLAYVIRHFVNSVCLYVQLACLVLSVPLLVMIALVPESPRWLFAYEYFEKGQKVSYSWKRYSWI